MVSVVVPGPAAGHHVDVVVDAEEIDAADQDGDRDHLAQHRQGQVAELLQRRGAVDRRRLERLLGQGAQAGHEDQDHERRPLPEIGQHQAGERGRRRGQHRMGGVDQAELDQVVVEHAELAVLHQQEHHAGDGGRHHQRQGHERAQEAVAAPVAVEQQGQRHAQRQLQRQGHQRVGAGHAERVPHALVGEGGLPLLEARRTRTAG